MKNLQGRWGRLLMACITLLMAGVIYAWSILKAPLAAEFHWTFEQTQFCFTLTLCFFCLGGLTSGLLSKKLSLRVRMLIAAFLIITGFTIAGTLTGSIYLMYLAYGVIAASGIGIVYNVVISATNAWFPDKKGLASGAMMMSFGFSALVLGKVADALFNTPGVGWRNVYLLYGAIIGCVMILQAFVIKAPEARKAAASAGENDVETRDMIKRISFWKLFVFFTLLAAVGSTAIGFGKDFFIATGLKETTAVTVAGLLSIFNGLGRLASGALFDKLGLRKTQYITSAVAICAPLIALIAVLAKIPFLGVAGLILCAFLYGFSPTVSSAFASAFYGTKNFALNFSVLNLVLIPASFVSTLAGSLVGASGGYFSTFIVLTAMSAFGLIVNISIKKA